MTFLALKMLQWDGTDLGEIDAFIASRSVDEQSQIRYTLWIDSRLEECTIHTTHSDVPIVLDELRPIFGLPKLGRHTARYRDRRVIVTRVDSSLERLEECQPGTDLDASIRESIVYHYLLGVVMSSKTVWWVRNQNVYGYRELTLREEAASSRLSNNDLRKWFQGDQSFFEEICCQLILKTPAASERYSPDPNCDRIGGTLRMLRVQIERVLERLNLTGLNLGNTFSSRTSQLST